MKKIIVSGFIVGVVVIICLLIKILFFNKTVPTGNQDGKILTIYSSKDMLGIWDVNITKQSDNLIVKSIGIMNISSFIGKYFYGTITIDESKINNKSINGDIVDVEGTVYNDIVTIYFDYKEEYLNINYDAEFTPKISNNHMVLSLSDNVEEENETYEYIFILTKLEVYNNEK